MAAANEATEKNIETDAKSPGRPKSEAKRQAIVEAARDLFLETGYEATSVDAVAATAGVSKATVYSHFAGKMGLFEAVVGERSSAVVKTLPGGGSLSDDPATDLVAFCVALSKAVLVPGHNAWDRLVIAESHRHPELAQTLFEAGPSLVRKRLSEMIAAHAEAGRLDVDRVDEAAEQLIGLTLGFEFVRSLMASQPKRSATFWRTRSERAVGLFLAQYGTSDASGAGKRSTSGRKVQSS